MMNWPPCCIIEAVPSRSSLPLEVIGREVPGLYPCKAVVNAPLLCPVIGLLVPGLYIPDMGRPELDIGRTIWEMPPGFWELLRGFEKEVPGLGAFITAFSSMRRSATPSSSISKSSIQLFLVRALHFRSQAA